MIGGLLSPLYKSADPRVHDYLADRAASLVPYIGKLEAAALSKRMRSHVRFDPKAADVRKLVFDVRCNFLGHFGKVDELPEYFEGMVESYRSLLERNSEQALGRVLRDRRFDRGLDNALEEDEPLSQATIDRMVDRYRANVVNWRNDTISRTEALRVSEAARRVSMEQAAELGDIPIDLIGKQWMSTLDARTRDTHEGLNGQGRPFEEPFDSSSGAQLMHPGDPQAAAAEIINCRCTTAYHVFNTEDEVGAFLRENE